jgi:hypothetical protein
MQLIRLNSSRQPSSVSIFVVGFLVLCYCLASVGLSCTIHYFWDSIADGETWVLVTLFSLIIVIISICIFMSIQPQKKFPNDESETFTVRKHLNDFIIKRLNRFFYILGSICSNPSGAQYIHKYLSDDNARCLHMDSFWYLDVAW